MSQDDRVEQHRLAPVALHLRRPPRGVDVEQHAPRVFVVVVRVPRRHGVEEPLRLGARVPVAEQADAGRRRQHVRLLDEQVQHVLRQGLADGLHLHGFLA